MSRLAALMARLAEKAEASQEAEQGSKSSSESDEEHPDGDASVYGSKAYWEQRYEAGPVGASDTKGELSNEWFVGYDQLRETVCTHLPKNQHVLIMGNGLSLLGEDMRTDGYMDVCAIDYSEACVQRMQERNAQMGSEASTSGVPEAPLVMYRVMDVTALAYEDESVASVLDKATLDTMFNMDDGEASVRKMLAETHRVLRPGGRYVVISYSEPEDRLPALQSPQFTWMLVEQNTLRKNKAEFYTYVLQKPPA